MSDYKTGDLVAFAANARGGSTNRGTGAVTGVRQVTKGVFVDVKVDGTGEQRSFRPSQLQRR